MKHVLENDGIRKSTLIRDAHNPGQVYVETQVNDKVVKKRIDRNMAARREGVVPQDMRNPLIDGDVIGFAFSFTTVEEYDMVKRAEPDLMQQVLKGTDTERMAAAQKLSILFPQYILTEKKRRFF